MSIFNDDEDEDFNPKNNEDKEDRIKRFLNRINDDEDEVPARRGKKKLIDVALKLGINSFIKSFPKIVASQFYEALMLDLFNHYTKSKFENLTDIDIENIIFVVKHFEDDEEYEKCHKITELYVDLEYRKG